MATIRGQVNTILKNICKETLLSCIFYKSLSNIWRDEVNEVGAYEPPKVGRDDGSYSYAR